MNENRRTIQSDAELLTVMAMEAYAFRKRLTGKEVGELFLKHQIFEKIVAQHEYLHQIPFQEVFTFVENEIGAEYTQLVLFHGTAADFERVELGKSQKFRDFGAGFYTTTIENLAKSWAYRLRLRDRKKVHYVYRFLFDKNDTLRIKEFPTLNEEWLEFVKENRSLGRAQHDYDVVIGPVADDDTMETVQLYLSGTLRASEAIDRLRYNKVNNQVSFHTEKALQALQLVGRNTYE